MRSLVLAALVGAVAGFLWGFVFWNVLPASSLASELVPDNVEVTSFLESSLGTGTHVLYPTTAETSATVATIFVKPQAGMGGILGLGFVHMVVAAFLMAWVVSMIPQLPASFGLRVVVVGSIGLVAAVGSNLGDPIWYNQPWSWHVVQAVYDFTFWIAAGLAIAWFVKPKEHAEAAV